jgi:serine/threonine protein kinase
MDPRLPRDKTQNRKMADTLLKGRYRHLAEIGRGERTVAYKALDTSLDRTVVVKVLREQYASDPVFVEYFQHAARSMAALSHPNIVGIYDIGADRDLVYVVTEHVEGQNLQALLASEGPLGVERALDIALPLCDALGAAHRAGYIHGQPTPRNVLLTAEGQVKVSDFHVEEPPSTDQARSPYAALYLSPEQLMGRRTTPASDVYSIGVLLYKMLSGHPPFEGEDYAEIAEQHIRHKPQPLHTADPAIPVSLSIVVNNALSNASADRYRSASELAEALRSYQAQSSRAAFVGPSAPVEPPEALTHDRLETGTAAHPGALSVEEEQGQGLDLLGCLMACMATVAVLGLIPLWLAVFLRYFA